VKLLLLLVSFLAAYSLADDYNTSYSTHTSELDSYIQKPLKKVLYISYEHTPQRVVESEVSYITIKTLSTTQDFYDINYSFSNSYGVEMLNNQPYRKEVDRFFYDTFYFYINNTKAKLPDITAKLISDNNYQTTTLSGIELNVIKLNPNKDYSNIVASSLELLNYKTTSYNNNYNIVVFEAESSNTLIKDMNFSNVYKQGIESSNGDFLKSKITYYVIIDKKKEEFSFNYFNPLLNKYQYINIPIIVSDDKVSTQTDLKPKDQSRERLKMNIAAAVALIGFLFVLWRKKYIYLVLILIPLGYILYLSIPAKEICIKKGSNIYLLPLDNGTIFEKTTSKTILTKEGSVEKFVKVKLKNNKIGWIKNEDICSR
jgi:hypothetical protein